MLARTFRLVVPVILFFCTLSCIAAIPPEIVAHGKRATALVEIDGGHAYGTAFCIDASEGYFVTNAHVANALGNKKFVSLILHSGETNQKKVQAVIVRADADLDLALLRVNSAQQLTALSLGSIEDLIETTPVTALGYPFGKDLSIANDEYPNVTVSMGHITSLRKRKGELAAIQIDAQLNPGNSGGPVLDDRGKVVGIVVSGIHGTGIDFAIPVSHLAYFLSSAAIDFTPPQITVDTAHASHEFAIHVSTFHRSNDGIRVSLTLSSGPDDHRTTTVRKGDNQTYTIHTAALPEVRGPKMLRLTAEDSTSKLTCLAPDQTVMLGGKPVLLSTISEIDRGDGDQVRMTDKEIKSVSVAGLDNIETRSLGVPAHMNLSHAAKITIESAEQTASSIAYQILVTQNGRAIGRLSGTIPIEGSHRSVAEANRNARVELFVCDFNDNVVKRFNGLTGAYIDDFASGNGLGNPIDAVFGPDGNLYVCAHGSTSVLRYNGRTGQFMGDFVSKDTSDGAVGPNGITFGPDGNLYMSSKWTKEVKRFDGKTGAFIDNFVTKQSGGLDTPAQLTFGPGGNLYVASTNNNCIKVYDGKTGAYLRDFISGNGIAMEWQHSSIFCIGPDGLFYVCSCHSGQIKRFNGETGQFIDNYIGQDTLGAPPCGVKFGPDGNLYVLTTAKDVKRFNGRTGKLIDVFISGNGMNRPLNMLFREAPSK